MRKREDMLSVPCIWVQELQVNEEYVEKETEFDVNEEDVEPQVRCAPAQDRQAVDRQPMHHISTVAGCILLCLKEAMLHQQPCLTALETAVAAVCQAA